MNALLRDEPAAVAGLISAADRALLDIGQRLRAVGYTFTTVTPETHRRVLARVPALGTHLRDVFGWNRPFCDGDIQPAIVDRLAEAGCLRRAGDRLFSTLRFSTAGDLLLIHSGFPTVEADAVFLGPDTYRFLQWICEAVDSMPSPRRIADIGAGSGAAALMLGQRFPAAQVFAADINDGALRFSRLNAILNGVPNVLPVRSDVMGSLAGQFDLVVANPPYLVDPAERRYRHGGGTFGADLSLRILREGVCRLSPQGRLVLYTGSAIVDGADPFRAAAELALSGTPWRILRYREIDPDVFGEELEQPAYAGADRIAAVGVVVGSRGSPTPTQPAR
jgi:SAM-dependent methyltransferase